MSRLLLEVGAEAIPAGYLPPAMRAMEDKLREGLATLRLPAERIRTLGTPKRLVVEIEGLSAVQEDRTREILGPRSDAAFRDGSPTPAAQGFARKHGVAVDALERVQTDKGEFIMARVEEIGKPAAEVLPPFLGAMVESLAWPKTMVWETTRFRFPRPIRWVVCLLDQEVLPVKVGAMEAGRFTRGHRLVSPGPQTVGNASRLGEVLADSGVVLDPEDRRSIIRDGLLREAEGLGGTLVSDEALVEEVVFLSEFPTVLSGSFDSEFLELPREVTVTAMRSHQRYFAVEDAEGRLLPHFLVVCDGRWDDPTQVVEGNERVLRARLSDARFYWRMDNKTGLEELSERLSKVTWLEAVGSLKEKSVRVADLVDHLGTSWYAKEWSQIREQGLRAARLSKADLASEMIKDGKEFTGLQGVIGARYAEAQGESEITSRALAEQYLPRGAGDPLPQTEAGTALAFADRLDTVVGCWAAGFIPTGSQDPYALRRAANGMVRILLEKSLHTSMEKTVALVLSKLPPELDNEGLSGEIQAFLRDRTAYFLREEGISYDVVDAVLAADADDPLDAGARARALQNIRGEEALERLVVGFKRAANILKGIEESKLPDPDGVDWNAAEPAELELHTSVKRVGVALAKARETKDYPEMLNLYLQLRDPIDTFFDDVLVMSKDAVERDRRLALLAEARELFHHVFDPARIVIEGEN